ncbi:MAG: hypothetical protein M3548_03275 [Actinomycetota bacterium]|nr:hypothetical protein [Actinomycetota bacterium]
MTQTSPRRPSLPASVVNGLRKRVADRVGRLIDFRINDMIPRERLDGFDHRLHGLTERHEGTEGHHRHRLDDMERRFGEVEHLQRWSANELERMIPQVAAIEARLASVDDALAAVPRAADDVELDQARSLIDEIRREHAQIRVRLTGVARYEERLGRLEEKLSDG